MLILLKGLLIGFAIAAPVGPIGVLCIRRTFAEGRAAGFATGLGAATADAVYGAIAAFGLTAVSAFLLGLQNELRLVGGLFLVALGIKTFFERPLSRRAAPMEGAGLAQAWLTTVVLTMTNPATILSFLAVFAGAGLAESQRGPLDASAIVLGVFLGSAAWWAILSYFVEIYRRKFPDFASWADGPVGGAVVTGVTMGIAAKTLQRVNRVSGALLALFGVGALLTARWG
jgi:threonine/homoserine/homoserine lactone efflux protein